MFKSIKNRLSVEIVFVVAALLIGSFVALRMNPLYGSDEIVHFPRAYHVAQGHLWTEHLSGYDYGGYVPEQIKTFNDGFREHVQSKQSNPSKFQELKARYGQEKLQANSATQALSFTSAGVYSPWAYLPAAIGVRVAQTFDLPLNWYVYFARLACLLFWAVATYFALRLLPSGKLFLAALALLPTSLVQAATIGMDGVVNGLSWLLIAFTIAVMAKKIRLTPKILVLVTIGSLFLATTKQGYLLIAALPLIIPTRHYPLSKKTANLLRIGMSVALVLITIWYLNKTGPIASVMHFIQRPGLYVDSHDQLIHIFKNPIRTLLIICFQPFTFAWASIYAGFVGVLTNKLLYLPVVIMVALYIGLLIAVLKTRPVPAIRKYSNLLRINSFVALFATFILINLALYVSFTQVGLSRVEGVQGRYLLPLAPLFLVFPLSAKRAYFNWLRPYSWLVVTTIGLGLISTVILLY